MFSRLLIFVLLLFPVAAAAAADPEKKPDVPRLGPLDLIPIDCVGAIGIRNVSELSKRGDVLVEKAELKVDMRLSDGYKFVVMWLGIMRGLDGEGAAALMAFKPAADEDAFVLAVPVADAEAMAGNFEITAKELSAGDAVDRQEREGKSVIGLVRYVALHERHLYMGGSPSFIERAIKAKRMHKTLAEDDRATLAADDVIGYVNRKQMGDLWDGFVNDWVKDLKSLEGEPSLPLREVAEAAEELQSIVAGTRLEDGVGGTLVLQFEGDRSRKILTQLQGGKAEATLAGLPRGRVLASHSSSGDGDASAGLMRSLLLARLPIDEQLFLSAAHHPNIVGVFGEVWQRLEGSRTALYENEHPERDGHYSLVAILETDNAERFVADVTGLAHFVNASTLSPNEAAVAIDAKTIAGLVAQLGDDDFRVRQLASTKLGLIGTPALAALEQAAKSKDPEVQFRAQALRDQINAFVAGQHEDLLEHDLLSRIKPSFAYFPKQETRAGRPVDIVQMKLRAEEAEYAPQLRRFLGPEWSKLRLAIVGQRVIVLLGSDTTLLDRAIANVKTDAPGLASDERYVRFRARTPAAPTAEFHVRLSRSIALATAAAADDAKPAEPTSPTTSLGITIAPHRLRLDMFAPVEEVRAVAGQMKG